MIELNINQKKSLTFELQVTGVDYKNLNGSLVLEIDGVEYGFPVKVSETSIIADIPPLKSIVKREIKHGEHINSRLSLNGDGFYLAPWDGLFEVKSPVLAEVKIIEATPSVQASVKARIRPTVMETKKDFPILKKKLGEDEEINDELADLEVKMIGQPLTKERKANNSPITRTESAKKNKNFEELRDDILKRKDNPKPITENEKIIDHARPIQNRMNITDRHIYRAMEMMGTTNKNVQATIYEACVQKAGSDEKDKILKEVIRFYKKDNKVQIKK
jgi:hypothetical protein